MSAERILSVVVAAGVSLGAIAPGVALAQASVETRASITVVDPRALGQDAALSMAPMARPSGASGVTARGVDGRYEVSGVAGDSVNIAMPSSLTLTRAGGAEEVLLQLTPAGLMSILPGAYGARSSGAVSVKGAVGVTQQTAPGLYKGVFPVILSLQ